MITTKSGVKVASAYQRIVSNEHPIHKGSYYEIDPSDIIRDGLYVPANQRWRRDSRMAYYNHVCTSDGAKLYHQKRTVSYADYIVGMIYISTEVSKELT